MTATTSKNTLKHPTFKKFMSSLGRLGKVLMFPIAVLPIAAILLRIGAQMPGAKAGYAASTNAFFTFVQAIMLKGGAAVFDNLPILFAIGIGFGLSKDNRGEAAFAAGISMFLLMMLLSQGNFVDVIYGNITIKGAIFDADGNAAAVTGQPVAKGFTGLFGKKYNAALASNVLNGVVVGCVTAYIYNRFNDVPMPKVLGFFSGRRLIPSVVVLTTAVWAIIYAVIFPWIGYVFFIISDYLYNRAGANRWSRATIMGTYGFINRLLIPFGLHHIPNNLFWFQLGEWHKMVNGKQVAIFGDINIFLEGVAKNNPGGLFQAGFFPIMMFGLPALAAVFWFTADNKDQKTRVLAIFGSAALVSFLTGITEPIEFAFMFVSPLLYFFHALLTGIFCFITGAFGIQLGFGFSAGFMDYLLSIPKSLAIIHDSGFTGAAKVFANPGWIFPIGGVCAASYFAVGYFTIKGLNLATPGRGANQLADPNALAEEKTTKDGEFELSNKARKIVLALGGWENIITFSNCSTRLRYSVKDISMVDEQGLKSAGTMGLMKISDHDLQIIIGTDAESLNQEIETHKGCKL